MKIDQLIPGTADSDLVWEQSGVRHVVSLVAKGDWANVAEVCVLGQGQGTISEPLDPLIVAKVWYTTGQFRIVPAWEIFGQLPPVRSEGRAELSADAEKFLRTMREPGNVLAYVLESGGRFPPIRHLLGAWCGYWISDRAVVNTCLEKYRNAGWGDEELSEIDRLTEFMCRVRPTGPGFGLGDQTAL